MKIEEHPHRRGEGRLSSMVPWERKGEIFLCDPISLCAKKTDTIKPF